MTKITKKTSVVELAAIITKALNTQDISAVLTGGAVVSIYTKNEYASKDLNFISLSDQKKITAVMAKIGFHLDGKDFYSDETDFTVEFPTGPLSLGDREPVEAEGEKKIKGTVIRLLSPTQCVMDRLVPFYAWNDRQGLDQAVMVASYQPIKLKEVELWSKEEGALEKFDIFLQTLKAKKK